MWEALEATSKNKMKDLKLAARRLSCNHPQTKVAKGRRGHQNQGTLKLEQEQQNGVMERALSWVSGVENMGTS